MNDLRSKRIFRVLKKNKKRNKKGETILRANIRLLEDLEEELGLGRLERVEELQELGKRIKDRLDTLAKVLRLLEKNGWAWTTGARDIILYKNIKKEDAKKMFKELKIPEELIDLD